MHPTSLGQPVNHIGDADSDNTVSIDQSAIEDVLNAYRDRLVASDASGCAALYADDGVTMAQGFESQVGIIAVKAWYEKCFQALSLDVKFDIKEVVVASPKWAWARTASAGTQKNLKAGTTSKESNQELFVFEKRGDGWKIARYCFSTTKGAA